MVTIQKMIFRGTGILPVINLNMGRMPMTRKGAESYFESVAGPFPHPERIKGGVAVQIIYQSRTHTTSRGMGVSPMDKIKS
ncbi:MAG: hypothetical protein COA73_01465 [Candidatus Hydrogenedentota bacterium]|nr:MAG: hypothetical protein COA73_01465 [Candidatus Hydrogenedentota bacterium]